MTPEIAATAWQIGGATFLLVLVLITAVGVLYRDHRIEREKHAAAMHAERETYRAILTRERQLAEASQQRYLDSLHGITVAYERTVAAATEELKRQESVMGVITQSLNGVRQGVDTLLERTRER